MKKRRVLHQACAFSVAVMLVGVNAVPVVAADNNSVAYSVDSETKVAKSATVTFGVSDTEHAKINDTTDDYGQHVETMYATSSYKPELVIADGYELQEWQVQGPSI